MYLHLIMNFFIHRWIKKVNIMKIEFKCKVLLAKLADFGEVFVEKTTFAHIDWYIIRFKPPTAENRVCFKHNTNSIVWIFFGNFEHLYGHLHAIFHSIAHFRQAIFIGLEKSFSSMVLRYLDFIDFFVCCSRNCFRPTIEKQAKSRTSRKKFVNGKKACKKCFESQFFR